MPNTVQVGFIQLDPSLVAEGVDLPAVDGTYTLIDDDNKNCRRITVDDLAAWYVDNNIASFRLLDINWLTLDVDNQTLALTYQSGATVQLVLGSINLSTPGGPPLYAQRNGIIYPIDENGNAILNGSSTPNLAYIRNWYHGEARRVNDQRLRVAEVVHAFSDIIGNVSNMSQ